MRKLVASACLAAAVALSAVPAHAEGAGPIVRTAPCPPGYTGRIIYIGDNLGWWGCYRLP